MSGPDASDGGPVRYTAPLAWGVQHVVQQVLVLLVAGLGLILTTWDAPVYQAIFDHVPDLEIGPLVIAAEWALPLFVPVALGIPLALTRYRAPLLLWIVIMIVLSVMAVIETSRLNWYAFSRGIAYRLESGPVPPVRTVGGLIVLLSGVLLLAQQSVRVSVLHLAARGVPAESLAASRNGLLRLERLVVIGAVGAGLVLTAIVTVSLRATEGAPGEGGRLWLPLVWTALVVGGLLASLAWALGRRRSRPAR